MKHSTSVRGRATLAACAALLPLMASAQPVITLPKIASAPSLQHQAADIGTRASFRVTASGTAPLAYQWRLDGHALPTNYDATHSYPLCLSFHGTPGDETMAGRPIWSAMASYRQPQRDPVIQLVPTRRAGDGAWTERYLTQVSALLDDFIHRFNLDTNCIYVGGGSEGVHVAWD